MGSTKIGQGNFPPTSCNRISAASKRSLRYLCAEMGVLVFNCCNQKKIHFYLDLYGFWAVEINLFDMSRFLWMCFRNVDYDKICQLGKVFANGEKLFQIIHERRSSAASKVDNKWSTWAGCKIQKFYGLASAQIKQAHIRSGWIQHCFCIESIHLFL